MLELRYVAEANDMVVCHWYTVQVACPVAHALVRCCVLQAKTLSSVGAELRCPVPDVTEGRITEATVAASPVTALSYLSNSGNPAYTITQPAPAVSVELPIGAPTNPGWKFGAVYGECWVRCVAG